MARFLNSSSPPCAPSSLCIFDSPSSQVALTKAQWLSFVPAFTTDSNGPYIFHIFDSTHFLQLNKIYISFKLHLTPVVGKSQDEAAVAKNLFENIAPTNFIGCSFFNQVKVAFNNVQLYDSTHYAYKSYLEALFSKEEHRKSLLSAAGFYDDSDNVGIEDVLNEGFKSRLKSFKTGTLDVCAPVLLEPFMTEKLLIPHINMQLSFYRNSDEFVMESRQDMAFKLTVSDMKLHVRAIEVNSAAALAVENKLRATPARYPFTSCRVKMLSVPGGRTDMPYTLLTNDVLPRKIIVALIDPEAADGKLTASSFNFGHNNVSEISIDAGGMIVPSQPITTNFGQNEYAAHYSMMMENLGLVGSDRCTSLTYRKLKQGHCLWAFNLSSQDGENPSWDLVRNGSTQIQIKFRQKTPSSGLTVLCWCYYDNQFIIDSWRNAHCENPL